MIFIVVKNPVRPEYADDWPSLVGEFVASARAEPGNISFDWFRSVEDPNLYLLVEAFRDEEASRAHVNSASFKAAMAQLPKWLSDVPEIINVKLPSDAWSRMAEMEIDVDGSATS